jgi:hypothetical protein
MAFTTSPLNAPAKVAGTLNPTPAQPPGMSARDRAIAKFMPPAASAPPANTVPVQDATRISPEESSIVIPPAAKEVPVSIEQKAAEPQINKDEAPTTATDEPLSAQYAQLARKEKALRTQVQELKRQQEAFKAAQDAIKPASEPSAPTSNMINRDEFLKDPWKHLNEMNLSYDALTMSALNGPKPEELAFNKLQAEVKAELQTMRDAQEQARKAQETQQQTAYQNAINQIRAEATKLVGSDPNLETIKETESIGDVVQLIEDTYKKDGVLLTVAEAAKQVEEYLVEEAMRLTKIKKIQQRLAPAAPPAAPKQAAETNAVQTPVKTLTNSMSASKPMSARERAVAAFEGRLKN